MGQCLMSNIVRVVGSGEEVDIRGMHSQPLRCDCDVDV